MIHPNHFDLIKQIQTVPNFNWETTDNRIDELEAHIETLNDLIADLRYELAQRGPTLRDIVAPGNKRHRQRGAQ